jgi:transposase-like protein
MPVAGDDYPAAFAQLTSWFPDDEACASYLARLRWPEGFRCPRCDCSEAWQTAAGLWLCRSCRHKTSVTAGTIFHRSRLPLTDWFAAVWFVTSQENGVSALGLQRVLGMGSYRTAWTWMHKLRRAMVRPDRDRLDGVVEVDETNVGGRERGKGTAGRGTTNKAVVAIAVEVLEPKGFGRVRLAHLHKVNSATLCGFVGSVVTAGATVRTDGWSVYAPLAETFGHQSIAITRTGQPAHVALPGVHRVASLLKRWLTGTLHYGYSINQLDYYLDEFTFRFNRRTARSRGLLFYRLLQQAVATDPHPYRELTTAASPDHHRWS